MITMTVFNYILSSVGWFLAGIGSTCLWRERKARARATA